MRLVVGLFFEAPEVALHGLLAARLVLLRDEGCLVSRHLVQVLCTLCDSCRDGGETHPACALIGRDRSRAVVLADHVDTRAGRVGGRCGAVSCQQSAGVTRVQLTCFRTLGQESRYEINTFGPLNFCHDSSAFAEQTVLRTERPFH